MIRLLTVLLVLMTLRKITGQIFMLQYENAPSEPALTLQPPPPPKEIIAFNPSSSQFRNQSPPVIEIYEDKNTNHQLLKNFQSRQEVSTSPRTENMNNRTSDVISKQPAPSDFTKASNNESKLRNNSDVYNKVDFRGNSGSTEQSTATVINNAHSANETQPKQRNNATRQGPDEPTITLDQRANFEGDKCPTGLIRVNGSTECVPPD